MAISGSIIEMAVFKGIDIMAYITIDKIADGKYYNTNSTRHAS
jgi:hypothetical protein